MGMASDAFWTFSSDVIITLGHFEQATANLVWLLIEIAGLAGGAAGDMIARLGLHMIHRCSLATLVFALGLLVESLSGTRLGRTLQRGLHHADRCLSRLGRLVDSGPAP